jgi:hypothetical protein
LLFVAEIDTQAEPVAQLLERLAVAIEGHGEVIETQVSQGAQQVFVVLEAADKTSLEGAITGIDLQLKDLAQVRLVGAELEDIKKLKPKGQYLVEWDFPEGLTMEKYLARKKEKAPLYADIQDVQFLRTYVREDMVKCLCFYDGDSEEAVLKAREVVDTPVSRIHHIEGLG